ncbi:MAG: sigma-70 family RNA polymerase sigma factor [bacterium]
MKADSRFVEIYRAKFTSVYRAAFVLCGDGSLAEDATQEAFAKALERWNRIGEEAWVEGWIMRTALNEVRKARRRRVRFLAPRITEHDQHASIELWDAVRGLPTRQQEAVVLYYLEDLDVDQVAAVMGCKNGTVKAHLWRARQELAHLMGGS